MPLSVSCSPSGVHLATAHSDGSVGVWDSATLSLLRTVTTGHTAQVRCVAWSPDSTRIASCSNDRTARVWEVAATGSDDGGGAKLEGHSNYVNAVAWAPDGTRIATGSEDRTVRVWDAVTFQVLLKREGHPHAVLSVAFSPCSRKVISTDSYAPRVWDAESGTPLLNMGEDVPGATWVACSPCGTRFATAAGTIRTVCMWDMETGKLQRTFQGHHNLVTSVAFSPNDGGARLVSASHDLTVRVWDSNTGATLVVLEGHTRAVSSAVVSPDGSFIFSVALDSALRKWNAQTGESILKFSFLDNIIALLVRGVKDGTAGTNIDLDYKPLEDYHVTALAEALSAPGCSVKRLSLNYCNVSPSAFVTLAGALKMNASLEELSLSGVVIHDEGVAALINALNINYTVTRITSRFPTPIMGHIRSALEANRNPTTRHDKKLAFEDRLQREGLVPVTKPAKILA